MKYTEINADLQYLDTFWKEMHQKLNYIKNNITKDLINVNIGIILFKQIGYLKIVKFSDINNWSVDFKNNTLLVLADKICNMIDKGDSLNITPLLKTIIYNKPRKLYKPNTYGREYLGIGHFRWNYQAYTLTNEEIQFLKNYFKL